MCDLRDRHAHFDLDLIELSVHAVHSPVPSCITGAQDVDEEDSEISMMKNDADDLNISGLDDTTRVEGECDTGNPTSLVEAADDRLQSRSDSLINNPGKRSTTDHSFGEETCSDYRSAITHKHHQYCQRQGCSNGG